MNSVRNSILKGALTLVMLQFVGHLTELLKQLMVASWFGTSGAMDAYLMATAVVGLVQILISRPIRQCLIPMFRHDLAQRGESVAWFNVSILFNNMAIVLLVLVVAGWFLSPYLVEALAPGFSEASQSLASSLAQTTMISVIFMGMAGVLSQLLFSYRRFVLPGSAYGVNNIVVIATFLALGGLYGIHGLAIAALAGSMTQFLLQLPILWQKRHFYCAKVDLRHPSMKEMARLAFPALLSMSGKQISRVTDRIFASLLPVGSLSALGFASGLTTVLKEFIVEAPDQAIFPHLTKLSAEKKFSELSQQLFKYLRISFFISLPVGIGVMVLAEPIVRLVYQRGAFDETSVQITSLALMFYAIGFPASAISTILSRAFFGLKDTWTPTKVAFIRHGVRILLAWILIGFLGHGGIALADSLSVVINGAFLFFWLPKELKGSEAWNTVRSFAQTVGASIVMLGVVYFAKDRLFEHLNALTGFVTLALLGAATYAVLTVLMRRRDMISLVVELAGSLFNGRLRKASLDNS
jgi:putative peptidoglycan lipid II flippase